MEIYQIRHFVAVVETGSFTKGADRAAVSQPALSASIARLEAELGVKLLDRNRSHVTPTPSGRKLLASAMEILRECRDLKSELRRASSPEVLRIGVLSTIASRKMSIFLRAYRRVRRGIAIELVDGTSDELIQAVSSRRLHVCFTQPTKARSKFAYQPLFVEKYCLVAPRDHPLANQASIELADLDGEPFIVRMNCEALTEINKLLAARGVHTRPIYNANQDDRVLTLIEASMGVTLMPAPLEAEFIKAVPVSDLDLEREIGLSWSDKRDDEVLTDFIAFASQYDWSASPPE